LFADGSIEWYATENFQALLNQPENQAFAAMLEAAQGQ
jgi:hypothetical protein